MAKELGYLTGYVNCPKEKASLHLHRIIKGIKHLNFKDFTYSVRFNNKDNQENAKAFRDMCSFLSAHFEGNSISFQNIFLGNASEQIASLIGGNPNLTSISFVKCDIGNPQMRTISHALENNLHLTEVTFDGGLLDTEILVQCLKKNSTLKVLNINDQCGDADLLEALKKNPFLTSFNIGKWETTEMRNQCNRHLSYNQSRYNLYRNLQLISSSDVTANAPSEVFSLIFNQLSY